MPDVPYLEVALDFVGLNGRSTGFLNGVELVAARDEFAEPPSISPNTLKTRCVSLLQSLEHREVKKKVNSILPLVNLYCILIS